MLTAALLSYQVMDKPEQKRLYLDPMISNPRQITKESNIRLFADIETLRYLHVFSFTTHKNDRLFKQGVIYNKTGCYYEPIN